MKPQRLIMGLAVALLAAGLVRGENLSPPANGLRPVTAFDTIADRRARSVALFEEAGKVIQHPRCVNCHPRTDRPTQGDAMTPHAPLALRGAAGEGVPGLHCSTCHHDRNVDTAGVPGNPHWKLAPREMAWAGVPIGAICRQIKDRRRNGGKSLEQIVHHMTDDDLVGWGWRPGKGRTPAPGTQAEFGMLIRAWADTGAHCPA